MSVVLTQCGFKCVCALCSSCLLSQEEHYFIAVARSRMQDVWWDQNPACILEVNPAECRQDQLKPSLPHRLEELTDTHLGLAPALGWFVSSPAMEQLTAPCGSGPVLPCGAFLTDLQLHLSSCLRAFLRGEFTGKHLAKCQKLYNTNSIPNQWALQFWVIILSKNFQMLKTVHKFSGYKHCCLCASKVLGTEKRKSYLPPTLGSIT